MTFVLNCPEPSENINESILIIVIIKGNWHDLLRRATRILICDTGNVFEMISPSPFLSYQIKYSVEREDRSGIVINIQGEEGKEKHTAESAS